MTPELSHPKNTCTVMRGRFDCVHKADSKP